MEDAPLTDLIREAQGGNATALNRIFAVMYDDLRVMARNRLHSHQRGMMLDTTSLVHESFLRFSRAGHLQIADRKHFLRYASVVMRSVVVDYARERLTERRGGGAEHVTLTTQACDAATEACAQILHIHDALEELGRLDERLALVVEMRYFAAMTENEIAQTLDITDRTVRRDWEKARLILADALK
ncbi:MAG: sigma-70 family RNA polymerase sigma factor [Steroidobacteraceae bacterium]|nr:sigma-70 family RNA polymerase sigma factor [Steroidobacteraceae bacterium]